MTHRIPTDAASPDDSATGHEFENLPSLTQAALQPAIETGSYVTPYGMFGDSPPEELDNGDYVTYRNETYQVTFSILDSQARHMTVQIAE